MRSLLVLTLLLATPAVAKDLGRAVQGPITGGLVMSPTDTRPHIAIAKKMVKKVLHCKSIDHRVLTNGMRTVVFLHMASCQGRTGELAMIFDGTEFYTAIAGEAFYDYAYPNGAIAFTQLLNGMDTRYEIRANSDSTMRIMIGDPEPAS